MRTQIIMKLKSIDSYIDNHQLEKIDLKEIQKYINDSSTILVDLKIFMKDLIKGEKNI